MLDLSTGQLRVSRAAQSSNDGFRDHVELTEGLVTQRDLDEVTRIVETIKSKQLDRVVLPGSFHNKRPIEEAVLSLPRAQDKVGYLIFDGVDPSILSPNDRLLMDVWKYNSKVLAPLIGKITEIESFANNHVDLEMDGICDVRPHSESR